MENQVIADMAYKKLWSNEDGSSSTDTQVISTLDDQELETGTLSHPILTSYFDTSSHTSIPFLVVSTDGLSHIREQKQKHKIRSAAWLVAFHGITGTEFEAPRDAFKLPNSILPKRWSQLPDATNSYVINPAPSKDRYSFDGIDKLIPQLAINSANEAYEPGMDNEYTLIFESAIKEYGEEFLKIFKEQTALFSVNALLSFIEVLGRLDHQDSKAYRVWMLNEYMANELAIVRDVASMAIVDLADSKAAGFLIKAIDAEHNQSLKSDMAMLLEDLEAEI